MHLSLRRTRCRAEGLRYAHYIVFGIVSISGISLLILFLNEESSNEAKTNSTMTHNITILHWLLEKDALLNQSTGNLQNISNQTNGTISQFADNGSFVDSLSLWILFLSSVILGILCSILLIPFIYRRVYFMFNCISCWRCISQETKHKRFSCIDRKPLAYVMNELYRCIMETVDHFITEGDAVSLLYEPLKIACTSSDFSDNITLESVGSVAEKFSLPYHPGFFQFVHGNISDFDFMMSPTDQLASFGDSQNTTYRIESENSKLSKGFVYLYEGDNKLSAKDMRDNIENIILEIPVKLLGQTCAMWWHSWLSSRNVNMVEVKINGPAITILSRTLISYSFYYDITLSIHCVDWPSSISNWEHRARKWPSSESVNRIITYGCHVVPKSPENDDGMAWRLSFSKAEVELSKLIPSVARKCYLTIKAIRKNDYYLSKIPSYFLKTILFNLLEKTEPNQWLSKADENIENCFHLLMDEIIKAFKNKQCLHFWIPDIDLLSDYTLYNTTCCQKLFPCYGVADYFEKIINVLNRVKENPHFYVQRFPKKFLERFPKITRDVDDGINDDEGARDMIKLI